MRLALGTFRMSPSPTEPILTHEDDCWFVTVISPRGHQQKYECATELQAQNLAALFRAPPRVIPVKQEVKTSPVRFPWLSRGGRAV